jgi:hypothetical protein
MGAAQDASELDEQMNEFNRLYRLYLARKITKNQFKAKTGLDVRGWPGRKLDDIDPDDDFTEFKTYHDNWEIIPNYPQTTPGVNPIINSGGGGLNLRQPR